MEVYSGSDQEAAAHLRTMQWVALKLGVTEMWIPLNGSSEDREEDIAFWKLFAMVLDIPIKVRDKHSVILG